MSILRHAGTVREYSQGWALSGLMAATEEALAHSRAPSTILYKTLRRIMGKLMKKKKEKSGSHQGFTGGGQTICSVLTQEQRHTHTYTRGRGRQACCRALPGVCHGNQDTPPHKSVTRSHIHSPKLVRAWMITTPPENKKEINGFLGDGGQRKH